MVWDAFFAIVLGMFGFVFGLLPAFTPPDTSTWIGEAAFEVGSYLRHIDHWVNVPLLVTLLGLMGATLTAWGVTKIVLWVYDRFPFKGT